METMRRGLMPLRYAARKYKIPESWLAREARAGRLPCLVADGAVLFDEAALLDALHKQASKGGGNG